MIRLGLFCYINVRDFPPEWREMTLTIEVEAKAKEAAITCGKNRL